MCLTDCPNGCTQVLLVHVCGSAAIRPGSTIKCELINNFSFWINDPATVQQIRLCRYIWWTTTQEWIHSCLWIITEHEIANCLHTHCIDLIRPNVVYLVGVNVLIVTDTRPIFVIGPGHLIAAGYPYHIIRDEPRYHCHGQFLPFTWLQRDN